MMSVHHKRCGCGAIFSLPTLKSRESRCADCARRAADAARAGGRPVAPASGGWVVGRFAADNANQHQEHHGLGVEVWRPYDQCWHWNVAGKTTPARYDYTDPFIPLKMRGPFATEAEVKSVAEAWARANARGQS